VFSASDLLSRSDCLNFDVGACDQYVASPDFSDQAPEVLLQTFVLLKLYPDVIEKSLSLF